MAAETLGKEAPVVEACQGIGDGREAQAVDVRSGQQDRFGEEPLERVKVMKEHGLKRQRRAGGNGFCCTSRAPLPLNTSTQRLCQALPLKLKGGGLLDPDCSFPLTPPPPSLKLRRAGLSRTCPPNAKRRRVLSSEAWQSEGGGRGSSRAGAALRACRD